MRPHLTSHDGIADAVWIFNAQHIHFRICVNDKQTAILEFFPL